MFRIKNYSFPSKQIILMSCFGGLTIGLLATFGWKVSTSVEIFMSQLGLYVVLAVIAGYLSTTRNTALLAATSVLVGLNLTYYLSYASSVLGYVLNMIPFTILALISGPIFGYIGNKLREDSTKSRISFGAVAGLLIGETIRMAQLSITQNAEPSTLSLYSISIVFNILAVITIYILLMKRYRISTLPFVTLFSIAGYLITLILR